MLAQRLRHRVDLQEKVVTQDSTDGSVVETWETMLEDTAPRLPAAIEPLSGREFLAAQAIQAGTTTRVTIRWRADVDAVKRFVHEGNAYNIRAVLPDSTLRGYLVCLCETGVNDG